MEYQGMLLGWGQALFANSLNDTGVTQPQQCRGACAGTSFGMI